MTKLVRDVVQRGIREFERHNPGWKLSRQAVRILQAHGAKHQRHIAHELESKRTSKAALAEGLRFVLEQSISTSKSKADRSDWGVSYNATYEESPRRRAVIDGNVQRQISVSALQLAMKNKCKTFPWC